MFWQDRGPDFFKVYQHVQTAAPGYLSIAQNIPLAASVFVPMNCRWPTESQTFLDTDFIIRPQNRLTLVPGRLFHARLKHAAESQMMRVHFGIEHSQAWMEQVSQMSARHQIHFSFIGATRLTSIFLTSMVELRPNVSERILLKNCSNEFFENFVKNYNFFNDKNLLSLRLETNIKDKILKIDDQAEIFYIRHHDQLAAAFLVLNMNSVRRFRWTASHHLAREKLNRFRLELGLPKILNGDILKNQIVSLPWWQSGQEYQIQNIFQKYMQELRPGDFDCIMIRDLPIEMQAFESQDILNFERRVFVFCNDQSDPTLGQLKNSELSFRLEPLCL
jgi:hypothetical protein